MESHKTYNLDNMSKHIHKKGLTLIEILLVIGIFTLIISLGLITDLGFLKSDILQTEKSIVVSLLERARNRSMSNSFQSPHGFCFIPPNYVIFRDGPGTRCTAGVSTNEIIPANTNVAEDAGTTFPAFVIFSQLSGTSTPAVIHLTDGIKTEDITINYEGRINW